MRNAGCLECGAATSATAKYCGTACRRAREFRIRRADRAVEFADRQRQQAELEAAGGSRGINWTADKAVKYWTDEQQRREQALAALLADDPPPSLSPGMV